MRKVTASKTSARRKIVAAKVIATGKPLSKIAKELGVSRKTVSEDFNAPETKDYLIALLSKRDERLEKLVDASLDAVEGGLLANRDDAADHAARLRAVERTTKLLELRAGKNTDGSDSKPKRWEGELVELLAIAARFQKAE